MDETLQGISSEVEFTLLLPPDQGWFPRQENSPLFDSFKKSFIMNIAIKLYKNSDRDMWERFVLKSNNGTLFHRQQFLDYHPLKRFNNHHLLFSHQGETAAIFPAVAKTIDRKEALISHPGASFGGFVLPKNIGISDVHSLADSLSTYGKEKGFQRIEMTLPPIIYLHQPNHYLDFSLIRHGYQFKKREVSSIITLNYSQDRILSTFKAEARTAVRKAIKSGVTVKMSQDYDSFYKILETNLKLRHGVTPTHTLSELHKVKRLLTTDVRLFAAFHENTMIAGLIVFVCNPRVLLAFYISHLEAYQKYRPVNLLMFEVIQWAIQSRFHFFDLGIFTVDMEPNWGLGRFKENFGAQGIFRDTYYVDL
jgi:hypothetical protein